MAEELTKEQKTAIQMAVEAAISDQRKTFVTRSEVDEMIGAKVATAIAGLETRIAEERRKSTEALKTLFTSQVGDMQRTLDEFARSVREENKRTDIRLDAQELENLKLGNTVGLAISTLNQTRRDIYGGEEDGPEYLFKILRRIETQMAEDRKILTYLKEREAWRTRLEQRIFGVAKWLVGTRRGQALLLTTTATLLSLAGKDFLIEQIFAPVLQALSEAP